MEGFVWCGDGEIEKGWGLCDLLGSVVVKEGIERMGRLEDDEIVKVEGFWVVECREEEVLCYR